MDGKEALKIVAFCNLILVLKYFMTIIFQGVRRQRAPEDGFQPSVIKEEAKQPLTASSDGNTKFEFSAEKRWQRIVMNDLENVQMGVIMIWISFFVAGDYTVTSIFAIAFTLARCGHTLCYIFKLMPFSIYIIIIFTLCLLIYI